MITSLSVLYVAYEGGYAVNQALEQAGYDPSITHVHEAEEVLSEMAAQNWDVLVVDETEESAADILALASECADTPALVCLVPMEAEELERIEADVYCTENLNNLGAMVARAMRNKSNSEKQNERSAPVSLPETIAIPILTSSTRQLAEHLPIGLYQSTPDGRVLFANEAMVDLLGYDSLDEIANLDIVDIGYPHEQFVAKMERAGEVRDHVTKWTDRRGRTKYTRENVRTVHDDDGNVKYFEGTMADITAEQEREERESREMSRSLAQQKALVELSTLPVGDLSMTARRATELLTSTTETARALVFLAEEVGSDVRCIDAFDHSEAKHDREATYPFDAYQPTFSIFDVERCLAIRDTKNDPRVEEIGATEYFQERNIGASLAAPIRRRGDVIGVVTLQHVGDVREWTVSEKDFVASVGDLIALTLERQETSDAEFALRESEVRYRAISELAADYSFGIHIYPDGHDEIVWATEAFERITGYTRDELDALDGLLSIMHPSTQDAARDAFARVSEGEDIDLNLRIVTKSGEDRWVHHRARRTESAEDGVFVLYNSGRDITAQKEVEAELIEAKEEALEMARMKSVFLANMSHEIRTPLTGILGFAGLLVEEAHGESREFARYIEQSGRRLMETLNSVLDMARIEANRVEVDLEVINVVDEAEQAVSSMSQLAKEKGLELRLEPIEGEVLAKLDKGCLCRVFTNLVGNAIKFTDEGEISIAIEPTHDSVLIRIADTGVGIDSRFLPQLFDEFRQETSGPERKQHGAGLGLAISKRLIELMGGSISVESERPGGSVFTIEFDLYKDETTQDTECAELLASDESIIIRPQVDATEDPISVESEETASTENGVSDADMSAPVEFKIDELVAPQIESAVIETEETAPEPAAVYVAEPETESQPAVEEVQVVEEVPSAPVTVEANTSVEADPVAQEAPVQASVVDDRPSVLVVEDNPDTRMLLERIIGQSYQVSAVGDARSALGLLNTNTFDALVLDINLGGKETGVDILRIARTLPGYEQIFAISLTAYALPGDRERFLAAGFNRYVSKPFTRSTLMSALTDGIPEAVAA